MQSAEKDDQCLADSEFDSTSNNQTQDTNRTFALRGMIFITILSFAALLLLSSAIAQQSSGKNVPGKYSLGYHNHGSGLTTVKINRARHKLALPQFQVSQIFANYSPLPHALHSVSFQSLFAVNYFR